MTKVFIDGSAGTTGLKIFDRLSKRKDIELIMLKEEQRKSAEHRRNALNSAEVAFLCLPDVAAMEAVSLVENDNTVLIDTSTAHRTNADWAYGFPELSESLEKKIAGSKRIAVPGCHASGFVALVYPLIEAGALKKDALLTCHSLTGYSGGGKKMIAEYEAAEKDSALLFPRQYGLSQNHKHLKEMQAISGLDKAPVFSPIVDNYFSGMEVTVPLFAEQLSIGVDGVRDIYKKKYCGSIVTYTDCADGGSGFLNAGRLQGKDSMLISVFGNEERILLTAVYDNLGKGASGAAIECLNIVTGADRALGLYTEVAE